MNGFTRTRDEARLAWTRAVLDDATAGLQRASTDAGFRSYWRTLSRAPGGAATCIVMDAPPDTDDVRPWLRIRALLERGGVRVPQVLAQDVGAGFLLLEDLGADTYLQLIDERNADVLFDAAIAQLLKLQSIAPPVEVPSYDEVLLRRELRLFDEWFLGRHLGVALTRDEGERLEQVYRHLIDAALAQPQVLVHRDFMPRNLMPAADGPAVLDFQDAVRGPIAYDPLSLFKDAFLSWPQARIDDWLDRYHALALASGLPVPARARFRHDLDWIGVQRHLKVLGIFARLRHRDQKPKYLEDAPRFLGYLEGVLPQHPQLQPLAALLDRHVRPALAMSA